MARAMATDPLHNFRFHARAEAVAGLSDTPFQPSGLGVGEEAEAGFQAITSPELTSETTEYREGLKTYTLKFPGIPTTNTLTFSRGVARGDTAFLSWVKSAIEGGEYRADVSIYHALRGGRSFPFNADNDFTNQNSKVYVCRNSIPARVKIAGDLDASTSDVSISEMDVDFEYPDVGGVASG